MNGKQLTELSNSEGCKKTNDRTDKVENERCSYVESSMEKPGKGGRTVQVK